MTNIRLNLVLFKGKTYDDGSHPIMLQYYVDGKSKRKVVGNCRPEDWDAKNKRLKSKVRNASVINCYLTQKYTEAEKLLFDIQIGEADKSELFSPQGDVTLSAAYDLELQRYKAANQAGTYKRILSNKTTLALLIDINTPLKCIDLRWLQSLYKSLQQKGHTGATDSKIIKTLRGIIARHSKTTLSEDVKAFRVPTVKTIKQKLTAAELQAVERLVIEPGTALAISRDIFLFQVYLRGARIGDVLQAKCGNFKDGRFTYSADKTGKEYSIALIGKAQAIVDSYKSDKEYLFPLFTWSYNTKLSKFDNELSRISAKASATSFVNNQLKEIARQAGINKALSSHIARHTFARMAIDKINNPMVTMELLGHTSLAVHQQYLKDIRKDDVLDAAAADIFE